MREGAEELGFESLELADWRGRRPGGRASVLSLDYNIQILLYSQV
jgi:hypothetical protein